MSEWLDVLSGWTGIRTETLVPLLVFAAVVVVIVVALIVFALGLIIRSTRRERAGRRSSDRST